MDYFRHLERVSNLLERKKENRACDTFYFPKDSIGILADIALLTYRSGERIKQQTIQQGYIRYKPATSLISSNVDPTSTILGSQYYMQTPLASTTAHSTTEANDFIDDLLTNVDIYKRIIVYCKQLLPKVLVQSIVLCYIILCYVMLCYVCCVVLCCVVCCVVWCVFI